jgi:hypothetical protein
MAIPFRLATDSPPFTRTVRLAIFFRLVVFLVVFLIAMGITGEL